MIGKLLASFWQMSWMGTGTHPLTITLPTPWYHKTVMSSIKPILSPPFYLSPLSTNAQLPSTFPPFKINILMNAWRVSLNHTSSMWMAHFSALLIGTGQLIVLQLWMIIQNYKSKVICISIGECTSSTCLLMLNNNRAALCHSTALWQDDCSRVLSNLLQRLITHTFRSCCGRRAGTLISWPTNIANCLFLSSYLK